jgi:hypothetical protein
MTNQTVFIAARHTIALSDTLSSYAIAGRQNRTVLSANHAHCRDVSGFVSRIAAPAVLVKVSRNSLRRALQDRIMPCVNHPRR